MAGTSPAMTGISGEAIVIGPQGVLDVVDMAGTLAKPFAGLASVSEQVHLQWVIYAPWDPERRKFKGETIYADPGGVGGGFRGALRTARSYAREKSGA